MDINSPWIMAGVVAYTLLWTAAYVLIIIKGFKDRSYGVPMVALCLNFSWEFLFSFVWPDSNMVRTWLYRFWFIPDAVIVWQLFRYGREAQVIPEVRKYFPAWTTVSMILSFLTIYCFVEFYRDRTGTEIAFLINTWMSIAFVFFYFNRRDLRGISIPAAWCKMLGTAITGVVVHFAYPIIRPDKQPWGLLELCAGIILAFDLLYIRLITRRSAELQRS